MKIIYINRPDFEYDILGLVQQFYPREDIRILTKETAGTAGIEGIDAGSVEDNCDYAIYYFEDRLLIRTAAESFERNWDYKDRRDSKNRLKQLLYEIISEETGKKLPWGTLSGIRPTKIPLKLLDEGKSRDEADAYMKDTYYCSPAKRELAINVAERELKLLSGFDYRKGYSLYIGIPFCPSTCLYCSFTSYPYGLKKGWSDAYLDALEKEIIFTGRYFTKPLHTIYVGGGTPTALSSDQLDRLLSMIEKYLSLDSLMELTVEAGRPDSITEDKLKALKRHGVDRISINPQTMKDDTLKLIGRHHSSAQTIESYKMARAAGFDNINMDMIIGLPGENECDVMDTLAKIREMGPDSLTIHSLALKRSSRLNINIDEYRDYAMDNSESLMGMAEQAAIDMGLEPYYLYRQKNMAGNLENVGFSSRGKECLYNILIMEERQNIVALGAGSACKRVFADGHTDRCENIKDVDLYIDKIDDMIERKKILFAEDH